MNMREQVPVRLRDRQVIQFNGYQIQDMLNEFSSSGAIAIVGQGDPGL
jgi:hypothetical protein